MRAFRPRAILASIGAAALAALVVTSPASAATLPEGQRITVAQNSLVVGATTTSQVWEVSPVTAAGTAVGGANAAVYPVTGIDVDDDGHGYALGREPEDNDPRRPTIATFDANTGAFGAPVPLDLGEASASVCTGIDYQPGEYPVVSCKLMGDGSLVSFVVPIDPSTGDYVGGDALYVTQAVEIDSIARQPGTDILWLFVTDHNAGTFAAAPLDLTTGIVGEGVELTMEVRGADFDRNGQLFASVLVGEDDVPSLATVNLTTGDITEVGDFPFAVDGESVDSNVSSLTVWGKPALAATGSNGAELVLPVALGSALLMLAGAAFVATNRIQRRVV